MESNVIGISHNVTVQSLQFYKHPVEVQIEKSSSYQNVQHVTE